jgi:hypothetical protein
MKIFGSALATRLELGSHTAHLLATRKGHCNTNKSWKQPTGALSHYILIGQFFFIGFDCPEL